MLGGIGDIGNWMDSTTGAFNYTGLVENMEMKAGAFYSMHFFFLNICRLATNIGSWICCSLGLACHQHQESPRLSAAEYDAGNSCSCSD